MSKAYKLKLVLGGPAASGKTTFLYGAPINEPPIGVSFKPLECFVNEGDSYKFIIWDLKDRKNFRFLFPLFCRGACGALICFDLTNREAFNKLQFWIQMVRKDKRKIPIILIGTKADLSNEEITQEEINDFIKNNKIDGFFPTSLNNERHDKEAIFKCLIEKMDENLIINDFSIFLPNQLKDEVFKKFLNFFSKCPICKKHNHFESLRSFYFSVNPKMRKLRIVLLDLIEKAMNFDDIYHNKINVGIPCCSCFKKYF